MRSLFVRIFLSYWVAQALFLVLAILVTLAIRPSGEIASVQAQQGRILNEAIQSYQTGGQEGARNYLRTVRDSQHVRPFLFDENTRDLTGRTPPDWILRVARGKTATADRLWGRFGPGRYLRQSRAGSDGHSYTLVIEFPPEDHGVIGPHGVPGLGILIAIISSGLV